ncbi:uncharacterized protein LOC104428354 [Eucalyptus grandis]|uniref:uncharacterized protein LOC104428354 n=1 Tax=Eucalyptus grandis TaxID=71139 RepID=UPI00192EEE9B|nr:uncharacterized protein LOC104428354 [Eucalyptus grandis]
MRDLQRLEVGGGSKNLSEATAVMKNLRTPKANLAKIEVLACVTAFLLMLITIFGSSRRRHNSQGLRILLWAIYTLSSYLIVYTLGLMTEASFRNTLLPIWAIFLMIFFGSSDSYSVHSLEDCERWKNYVWQYVIKITGVSFLLVMSGITLPMFSFLILCLIVPLKVIRRAASLKIASGYGRQMNTKSIADYMISEHQSSEDDLDPSQMRGYNYVVKVEKTCPTSVQKWKEREAAPRWEAQNYRKPLEITDRVVTVEKVWKCQGWLLRSGGGDKDSKLKDICLSFSLYKLLRLKFSDYSLPKRAHEKAWKLIQYLYAEGNGYERVFRVVELELSFLYDSFYTKYLTIFQTLAWRTRVIELLLLVIGVPVTIGLCFPWYDSNRPQDEVQLATTGGLSIDFLVTVLILLTFVCVELVQCCFMVVSDWTKVALLCKYVRTNSWQESKLMEKLIGLICWTPIPMPWERKLHQYSLLESYDYTPSRWLYNIFTELFMDPIRDGQTQSKPANLSSDVKKAVFRSLMSNREALQNGEASLIRNEVEPKFSWACRLGTKTQVIFVWHIATRIFEHTVPISDPNSKSNFLVATNLSKYLAYLVAFYPKLLPDHSYDSEFVFDEIIIEARYLLKGCKTIEERIQRLNKRSNKMNDTNKVMIQGVRLGQQLLDVENEPNFIWKVLAEFWAELMVYVAPSDNAMAHARHLAMGGEFVTHLWALVSHAGIERADEQESPVEQPTLNRS